MFTRTGSDGKVKLTEEEKETFVSEGLPVPNRIPLTKVSVVQKVNYLGRIHANTVRFTLGMPKYIKYHIKKI